MNTHVSPYYLYPFKIICYNLVLTLSPFQIVYYRYTNILHTLSGSN